MIVIVEVLMPMPSNGFFHEKVLQVARVVNTFKEGTRIDVKRVRRVMVPRVDASNRSEILFISRALDFLNHGTFLDIVKGSHPKKYHVKNKIDIDALEANACDHDIDWFGTGTGGAFLDQDDEARVDAVVASMLDVLFKFKQGEIVKVRDVLLRMNIHDATGDDRNKISRFISFVFSFLMKEGVLSMVDNKNVRKYRIEKKQDTGFLSIDFLDKFPRARTFVSTVHAAIRFCLAPGLPDH